MKEKNKFKHIDPNIVDHYLDGKGNSEELQQIADWFSNMLANDELRKYSYERWTRNSENIADGDYDEIRLQDRIHHILRLEESKASKTDRSKEKILRFIQRAAAVLIIPLAIFSILNLGGNLGIKRNQPKAVIYAPPGARTNFTLPDGSEGWLNVGSSLSFPATFSGKRRTVSLVGEAYFNVKSNPKKPFVVETEGLKVKVHGTKFNLMAYPDEDIVEVSLETGKVEVIDEVKPGLEKSLGDLAPGEIGVFWKESNIFRIEPAKIASHTAWKEGKLVLNNEPMEQVVNKLNRWYNVKIILMDDRLKDYTYRATFVDEKLDEVLKIFSLTSPIVYKELEREKSADGTYKKRIIEFYYNPK